MVPHPYNILMKCKYCGAIVLNNDEYFVCISHGFLHHGPSFLSAAAWKIWCLTWGTFRKCANLLAGRGPQIARKCVAGRKGTIFWPRTAHANLISFIISLIHHLISGKLLENLKIYVLNVLSITKCGNNECREGVKRAIHCLRTIYMAPDCKRFIALFIAAYSTAYLPVYSLYYEMMRKFWAACRLQRTGDIKRLTAIFTILYSHIVPEGMYAFRGMTSNLQVQDKKRHVCRLLFN